LKGLDFEGAIMEMLLLFLVPVVLGSFLIGGGNDGNDGTTDSEATNGTDGNDVMRGASLDVDVLNGGAGDDLLFGYGGADTLVGDDGSDFIDGGNGDDVVTGGAGDDVLAGGVGDDSVNGGTGNDLVSGGEGDDTVVGGNGDDIVVGSTGADQLYGGAGDDLLDGATPTADFSAAQAFSDLSDEFNAAFDSRYGDAATTADFNRFMRDIASEDGDSAPDALYGGAGEDWLIGNDGDTLTGGADQDFFSVDWASGNDVVSITDFDAVAEDVAVQVYGDGTTVPDFGIRDAADGAGVEIVVDEDVVATLADVTVATISTGQITMELITGDSSSIHAAVVLPALAA
jgi:Ca2+-binding RTX toxin-like protein